MLPCAARVGAVPLQTSCLAPARGSGTSRPRLGSAGAAAARRAGGAAGAALKQSLHAPLVLPALRFAGAEHRPPPGPGTTEGTPALSLCLVMSLWGGDPSLGSEGHNDRFPEDKVVLRGEEKCVKRDRLWGGTREVCRDSVSWQEDSSARHSLWIPRSPFLAKALSVALHAPAAQAAHRSTEI